MRIILTDLIAVEEKIFEKECACTEYGDEEHPVYHI